MLDAIQISLALWAMIVCGFMLWSASSALDQDTSQLKNAIAAQTRPQIQASMTMPMAAR
ncbi:hypothetical protein [Bradyrhizobium sp. USDA 4486]